VKSMGKAKTSAERQAARRERLAAGGLFKRRDFYVHVDDEPELRKLERKMREKRMKASCPTHTKKGGTNGS